MNIDPSYVPEEHNFDYRGKQCRVKVYKTGKTTYTAIGTHGDDHHQGRGQRSPSIALESWKNTVKYSDSTD